MSLCTCAKLRAPFEDAPAEWKPECTEHGVGSDWYRDVGRPKFEKQSLRLAELQRIARLRRKGLMDLPTAQRLLAELERGDTP